MKWVLLYESADDVASRAPQHFDDHWAHCLAFRERGSLELIGTFEDPQSQGAMGVFATREAAEEFARDDPFVRHGVVARWEVRGWDEAFTRS